MSRCQSGMTLLEITVALALFALISAAAFGGLQSVLQARAAVAQEARELNEMQLAWQLIENDLSQVIARSVRNEFGLTQPAFALDTNQRLWLGLTRAGWDNPLDQPRSHLQRVQYRKDQDRLLRGYWFVLDGFDQQPREAQLFSNVSALRVRVLDHTGQWQTRWPPPGAADHVLPRAVEIAFETPGWGEIRRLFPLVDFDG